MSEMTPAALDRWLAEHVMGWTWRQIIPVYAEGYVPPQPFAWHNAEGYVCALDGFFVPTANIAQAIECAEKARADGRIVDWNVHFDWAFIYPTNLLAIVEKCAQGEIRALSLCRALHAALA